MSFVHLHVHSHYSLLDGLPKIDELVDAARKQKMSALALTDYGSMYGAIEFYKAGQKAGVKPIIGLEVYLARGSRRDRPAFGHPDYHPYHLVLLAEDYSGYRNLMKISSLGFLEGLNTWPRVDREVLEKHHQGIIVLSGCRDGEIAQLLLNKEAEKARAIAAEYARIFGPEHFYLEMQDHPELPGQNEINNGLLGLAEALNLPLVVTRDVHYLHPEDSEAQDVLTCIREGRVVDDPGRPNKQGVDRSFNSEADIASRFRHVPEALENTGRIAERCNLTLELGKWHFPPIPIPEGKTAEEVLIENANSGIRKLMEVTPEVQTRLDYELGIITKKGYAPYFLAVADYVIWTREQGIIATTRGSAAGSLVSYAIGVTNVNPLSFKLPFERFLNPFRPSPPDIDMDFADNRRDEVIAYVTGKYGKEKVAQIITFGTMAARGSVRDVGRALGYSYSFCDQISKMIPFGTQGFPMTLKKALETTPELYALYNQNPQVQRLLDLAQKIEGCARHTSIHAAGVVISPTPLTDFTPVQFETGGEHIVTQYEMGAVEAAGVLKMDFLGVRNLSILGDAVKIVSKTRGIAVDLQNIPWDDQKTFAMLARGETGGLFQLGGSGMTRYLEELKPTNLFDIMAMVALFRPGPMDSIPEFIKRKHNPKTIKYLDERMKDYLDMSYGVITYQDDVLLTAINIAGYNWEEADKLRKAMGKKIPEEMAKQKEKFLSGCLKNGLDLQRANELWKLIEPFAAYGFNKAHAASYAVIAYQTAYMKAHYPEEYMAAVMSAEAGDIERVAEIVNECKEMGLEVLPPDVNESFELFAVVPKRAKPTIRFGLQAVKNVGAHIAEVIIRERKAQGPYAGLEDFLGRIKDKDLNKKSLESLIKCGALDCFGNRGQLLGNIELLTAFCRDSQKEVETNQNSLFALGAVGKAKLALKPVGSVSSAEQLAWEKELIGLYISAHPFTEMNKILGKGFPTIVELFTKKVASNWAVACGLIATAKKIITKKGDAMLFVTLEDGSGQVEVIFFPKIYEKLKTLLEPGKTICVVAKYSDREGEKKLLAEKAELLTPETVADIKTRFVNYGSSGFGNGGGEMNNFGIQASGTAPAAPAVTSALVIPLSGLWPAEKTVLLKELLKRYAGETKVYLKVGEKKIDIGLAVDPTPQFKTELRELLVNK